MPLVSRAFAGGNGYGDIIPTNENLYEGLTRYKNGGTEIEPAPQCRFTTLFSPGLGRWPRTWVFTKAIA